jgi:hypothetical protein
MNTVTQLLEASALPLDAKEELKALVAKLLADRAIEVDAESDIRHTKSGVNERQYSKRMAEPMSEDKRSEAIRIQHAWRSWLANAVFRAHEVRARLSATAAAIAAKVAELGPQKDRSGQAALVAVSLLIGQTNCKSPDDALAELDNVSELNRDRIFEAVRSIFESKLTKTGLFVETSFSCSAIEFSNPTAEQLELTSQLKRAEIIRQRFEDLWSEFISAKSKCNYPQFTRRIESLQGQGETARVEEVRRSLQETQARLYVAAVAYAQPLPELRAIEEALEAAIKSAANSIADRRSLDGHKAMSACIVGWKWLYELASYIEDKYRGCNPEAIIAELEPVARKIVNG